MSRTQSLGILAVAAILATPAFTPAGQALAADSPSSFSVDVVTANGTGCPRSAAPRIQFDDSGPTLTFPDFQARIGNGAAATDIRKNCQLSLAVNAPGWSYALVSAEYSGFAALDSTTNAVTRTNYYFQGYSQTSYVTHTIRGPKDDDWASQDQFDTPSLAWSPCGEQRYFNLNTEVRVSRVSGATTGSGWITLEKATKFSFAWKRCPGSPSPSPSPSDPSPSPSPSDASPSPSPSDPLPTASAG